MKVLTLHRIDRWDGGDRHLPTEYHFEDRATADAQKGEHDHITPVTIVIIDDNETLAQAKSYKLAASAVTKLTAQERRFVGLPEDLKEAIDTVVEKVRKSGLV